MEQRRSASQVVSVSVDGTTTKLLGQLGHVSALNYGFTYPGGCDQMTCLLTKPPTWYHTALDPGREIQVWRGLSRVWTGKADQATPGTDGWQISAHGSGTYGTNYRDKWSTWNGNDGVNQAIARGLRWRNPGISGSGLWLGQQQTSASITITDFMNLLCSMGGYGWYVDRADGTLNVAPLPVTPNRILNATVPVARTITADIDDVYLAYTASDDGSGNVTTGLAEASLPASIAVHDRMESYVDLTGAGVMSGSAAIANGNFLLAHYVRANWAGSFQVRHGQILTAGGTPVDLGCEQAGGVDRLQILDGGYGGEIVPGPIAFIRGGYVYDDDSQTATVTPYQSIADDMDSLAQALATAITPITS